MAGLFRRAGSRRHRRRRLCLPPLMLAVVLECALQGPQAYGMTPQQQVDADMQAWPHDCSERALPSSSHIGACSEPQPELYLSRDGTSHPFAGGASCAAAFDGNSSTFVDDIVLNTDQTVFGEAQPSWTGNPNGTYVGINLHGHLVHLTGVTVVARAPHTDWQPRKHPYSPALETVNWTMTLAGAVVQGSRDLTSWTDLYTFDGVLAPHPMPTTFTFEAMGNGSCAPYSAFRLQQVREIAAAFPL